MTHFAAFTVSVTVAACQSQGVASECRLHSDCTAPELCEEGRCVPSCREDRDCRFGEHCGDGRCIPIEEPVRLCSILRECRADETCSGGVCSAVRFVKGDAGVDSSPGFDGSSGPDASDTDTGLAYGAVCARGTQCNSGLCLGRSGAGSGRCTNKCGVDLDCQYPDRCVDIQGAGKLCGPTAMAKATGEPCPGGATDCASGLCAEFGSGPICTQSCAPLPTCPLGFTCAPIATGSETLAVCFPGTGKGFGEVCSAASECGRSLCVAVRGSTSGLCTALCDAIPCPAGYGCLGVPDGAGGEIKICAHASATGGSYGDRCTGASGCMSGLCLSDARTQIAVCTEPCTSNSECAAVPGFVCVQLASTEQVCGPE